MKWSIIFLTYIFLQFNNSVTAQSLGSWNIMNVRVQFSDKWSVMQETQTRSYRFYNHFFYNEFKGGVSYKVDKNFSILLGGGTYDTYTEGGNFKTPMTNDETRTWVQLTMNQQLKRIKFEHRYRAEQRFTSSGYRNRFRYRFGAIIPLNKKTVEPGTVLAYAYNELFFTNKAPYFERNRASAGLGYEFNNIFTLQAGYLSQFDYRIGKGNSRNYFQLSLLFDIRPDFSSHENARRTLD
jgi:hypothetical protein